MIQPFSFRLWLRRLRGLWPVSRNRVKRLFCCREPKGGLAWEDGAFPKLKPEVDIFTDRTSFNDISITGMLAATSGAAVGLAAYAAYQALQPAEFVPPEQSFSRIVSAAAQRPADHAEAIPLVGTHGFDPDQGGTPPNALAAPVESSQEYYVSFLDSGDDGDDGERGPAARMLPGAHTPSEATEQSTEAPFEGEAAFEDVLAHDLDSVFQGNDKAKRDSQTEIDDSGKGGGGGGGGGGGDSGGGSPNSAASGSIGAGADTGRRSDLSQAASVARDQTETAKKPEKPDKPKPPKPAKEPLPIVGVIASDAKSHEDKISDPGQFLVFRQALAALAADTPADPRRLRPDVPAGLAKLVLQLLAKDPAQRPASAREVADRLAGLDAPSAAPGRLTSRRVFVGAGVLVGLILLAAWIIPPLFAPRLGTMETETAEDDLEPLMAAADLRFVDRATGHQVVARLGPQPLPPGTYELADLRGGGALDIAPETFTLRAGAVAIVRVRRASPPGPLEAERVVQAHPGACHLALSGDGRLLATGENDQVRLWDPASGRLVREWRTPGLTVSRMAFEPNGRRLAGCFNQNLTVIWDAETGNELRRLAAIGHWSSGADFHPDGRRLVSTSYRHLEVWDLDAGKRQATGGLRAESNMYMLSTHPAGRFVATPHHDSTIGIWDLDSLSEPRLFTDHAGSVEQVAFRPDGRELASASFDGTARVRTFPDGQVRLTLRHALPVRGLAWAGAGRWLLTASRHGEERLGEVKVWDTKTGQERYSARLDARQLYVAGTTSGRRFATAGEDGKLRIWQLPD